MCVDSLVRVLNEIFFNQQENKYLKKRAKQEPFFNIFLYNRGV